MKINYKTLKYYLISAVGMLTLPVAALAQSTAQQRCQKFASQFDGLFKWALSDPGYCTLEGLLLKVINMALGLAGTAAVVVIIYGGYLYITSAGNAEQAEKGRKALTNAVIGLVLVGLSYMIVRIVSNSISKGVVL